ncbi:MAG: DNA oxidative demethylase AlkB [Pseudohongiella sp.]|nr:DNA oxidative demethylase AlkB [Pseudohongiella sp.]MDP3516896.1 DNA oxidative demethylase AlkB [Pseudohongiella sp.]
METDLFQSDKVRQEDVLAIGPGSSYLGGFLVQDAIAVLSAVAQVTALAPFRHLTTPGGQKMSVAMSNCGRLGWVSDHAGYRYQAEDPLSGKPWPSMPALLLDRAQQAAELAGYSDFQPTVCLINRYEVGARMGLHQDRDERNLTAPIVSFSLGIPATFIWGGLQRTDKPRRFLLKHGDAVVWGGQDRLRFHGVAPIKADSHALTGPVRINITFRQTGL